MRIMNGFIVMLIAFVMFLSGCGAGKQMSREDQLALRERLKTASTNTYTGFTKEQIFKASEKVMTLIDPADANFSYAENRMVMTRAYSVFLGLHSVHGYDFWILDTKENDDKSISATVIMCKVQSSGAFASKPEIPGLGNVTVNQSSLSEAEARIFFKRLDYMLGIEKTWMTKELAMNFVAENKLFTSIGSVGGHLPFICGDNWFGVEDKGPEYFDKKE